MVSIQLVACRHPDWDAKWYAEKEYVDYLHEDLAIRTRSKELVLSTIEIQRVVQQANVSLHTAKPGGYRCVVNVDALRAT